MTSSELNELPSKQTTAEEKPTRHLDEYEVDLVLQFFNILHRWDVEAKAKAREANDIASQEA
jgi:hypothetical protein